MQDAAQKRPRWTQVILGLSCRFSRAVLYPDTAGSPAAELLAGEFGPRSSTKSFKFLSDSCCCYRSIIFSYPSHIYFNIWFIKVADHTTGTLSKLIVHS